MRPSSSLSISRRVNALFAVIFTMFALTGCGGGGGGSTPTPPVTPDLAPTSINGHSIVITDPDQTQITTTYKFDSATYSSPGGDSGNYTWSKTSGSTTKGTLQLTSVFTSTKTFNLTFTSSTGGTYVDQSNKNGTFTYQ